MSTPSCHNQESELSWTAFRYVVEELSESERTEFEARLADDQAAREALARSVQIVEAVAPGAGWPGLDRREVPALAAPGHAPLCPGHPVVPRQSSANRRSSISTGPTAGLMALAASVAFLAGLQFAPVPDATFSGPEQTGQRNSADAEMLDTLIALWSQAESLFPAETAADEPDGSQVAAAEPGGGPVGVEPIDEVSSEGEFDWLLSALILEDDEAPQEN